MSISATLQWHRKTNKTRWEKRWAESPRFSRLNEIDPKLLAGSFTKLVAALPKKHTSALIWLRTGHCPLHSHLKKIKRAETDKCRNCPDEKENLLHYLVKCPQYAQQRHTLRTNTRHRSTNLAYLLADPKGISHLLQFVGTTGRFKSTLGNIPPIEKQPR